MRWFPPPFFPYKDIILMKKKISMNFVNVCSKTILCIHFKFGTGFFSCCTFFLLEFTPSKAEQSLKGIELKEKEAQKD